MLLELYIFYQVVAIGLCIAAYFTRQPLLWAVAMVVTAMLTFTSWDVEKTVYEFDNITSAYVATTQTFQYGYLFAINLGMFLLALIYFILDIMTIFGAQIAQWTRGRRSI